MTRLLHALPLVLLSVPALAQTIVSLNPASVTAAGPAFTLAINGTGFAAGSTVLWNGTPLPTTYVNPTELTAGVSVNLIWLNGTVSITVQSPGGSTSNAVAFVINPLVPSISMVQPTSTVAGGAGFNLEVYGSGFLFGVAVLWDESPLSTSLAFFSSNALTAQVPASLVAAQGSATITVVNQGRSAYPSNAVVFNVSPRPLSVQINGFSPGAAVAGGAAFNLTVTGSGFVAGAVVEWSGAALATTFASANQLVALVPANLIATAGQHMITVLNPSGAISNAPAFMVMPAPSLSQLTVTPNPVALSGSVTSVEVTVGGSGPFTIINQVGSFFSLSETADTAPTTNLYVSVANTSCSNGNVTCSGSFTLHPTSSGGGTDVVVSVSFCPGNGCAGGGVISANPTSVTFNTTTGAAVSATVNLTTASTTAISFSLTTTPASGSSWLSVSENTNSVSANSSATLNVYANATNITTQQTGSITITPGNGGAQTVIPVTLSVNGTSSGSTYTVSPTTVSLSYPGTPSSQQIVIHDATTNIFNAAVTNCSSSDFLLLNGLAQASNQPNSGYLTLTLNNAGSLASNTYTCQVVVSNPSNYSDQAVINVTLTVNGGTPSLTIITASPLPAGTVGVAYSQALAATGGVTPYKGWAVVAGSLPPGTSLSTLGGVLTGLLTGIPTTPGVFTFTVQVTDNVNSTATKQFSLTIGSTVTISANGIVNAASYAGGSVAPGEIVVIFGSGLGPNTLVGLQLDSRGNVSTSLSGTQVLFDGIAAPLIYAQAGAVSAVAPYEVSGKSSTQVQVIYQGQTSNVVAMPVTSVVPGIFTDDASGHGQAAVVNEDGTVNSASNPAVAGSIVFFYATGEGQTAPGGVDGQLDGSPAPAPVAQPVTVTVGGISAPVRYAGGVPGLVAGVLQVNAQVPAGISTGNSVPIVLSIAGKSSQAGVTLAVR